MHTPYQTKQRRACLPWHAALCSTRCAAALLPLGAAHPAMLGLAALWEDAIDMILKATPLSTAKVTKTARRISTDCFQVSAAICFAREAPSSSVKLKDVVSTESRSDGAMASKAGVRQSMAERRLAANNS